MSHSDRDHYRQTLRDLQIELVRTQIWLMAKGRKTVVLLEGRDAAGKDGTIHRLVEHLSPRATRVVALPKPSDRDESEWWFQRYVRFLPAAGEMVIFNRSWYNRAGVERVMGFCKPAETEQFLLDVPDFERMVEASGARLVKYWLDVSRKEQKKRIDERQTDPLKRLKTGPLDIQAEKHWDDYTAARDEMLMRSHTPSAPWTCVRADDKKTARLNVLRHLLRTLDCPHLTKAAEPPDPAILFPFEASALTDGRLER